MSQCVSGNFLNIFRAAKHFLEIPEIVFTLKIFSKKNNKSIPISWSAQLLLAAR
jgi:hypothetical protein